MPRFRYSIIRDGQIVQERVLEVFKTKAGKFTSASQKNIDQLLDCIDATSYITFGDVCTESVPAGLIRNNKMIEAIKHLRSRYNTGLRSTLRTVQEYILWPSTQRPPDYDLIGAIKNFDNAFKSGEFGRELAAMEIITSKEG
jgi:hypothetical protein